MKKATPTVDIRVQVVMAAKNVLALTLGIGIREIVLVEITEVTWPDSSLGLPRDGEMCAQVLTKGYRIVLQVRGTNYISHTNKTGTMVRFEN
jgi:hypothetical protein